MDDDQDGRRINLVGVGAAIFVLALAVIAAVILIAKPGSGHGNKTTSTQAQAATPGTSQTSTVRQSSTTARKVMAKAGVCSLPAGNQQVPSASPPAGTSWGQIGSMSVPQAPRTLGPQLSKHGFEQCFAHSPSGALLAAMNFYGEGTAQSSGKVYAALAINVPRAALSTKTNLTQAAGGSVQIAGYKFDSYTSQTASMTIVIAGPQGKLVALITNMDWHGSDWRYDFPPNGQPSESLLPGTSVQAPYVPWSAF